MEYKRQLGAELIARTDFVREVHRTRVENKDLVLRCNGRRNAKEIIDFDRPDNNDATNTKRRSGAKHEGAKKRPHDEK
eukprot:scaffold21107_cov73-Skeletonema_marinoi.AAC.1